MKNKIQKIKQLKTEEVMETKTKNENLVNNSNQTHSNEMNELKNHYSRFYNFDTKQTHRFLPLFENKNDGLIMGVCMDTSLVSFIRNNTDESIMKGWVPSIRKGQFVVVSPPELNRVKLSYKDEPLFQLKEVCENHLQNLIFNGDYSNYGWEDYKK